jgi:hypothetical protein
LTFLYTIIQVKQQQHQLASYRHALTTTHLHTVLTSRRTDPKSSCYTSRGATCDMSSTLKVLCPLQYGGTGEGCQPPNLITTLINIALKPGMYRSRLDLHFPPFHYYFYFFPYVSLLTSSYYTPHPFLPSLLSVPSRQCRGAHVRQSRSCTNSHSLCKYALLPYLLSLLISSIRTTLTQSFTLCLSLPFLLFSILSLTFISLLHSSLYLSLRSPSCACLGCCWSNPYTYDTPTTSPKRTQ